MTKKNKTLQINKPETKKPHVIQNKPNQNIRPKTTEQNNKPSITRQKTTTDK